MVTSKKVVKTGKTAVTPEVVRKRAFGHRAFRTAYSHRAPGLNVRTWLDRDEVLIRDDAEQEVSIREDEIDSLIKALYDIKEKRMKSKALS